MPLRFINLEFQGLGVRGSETHPIMDEIASRGCGTTLRIINVLRAANYGEGKKYIFHSYGFGLTEP